ncbi:MAG: TonB-dependent receptor [Pseudomonadota bacterium]
MQLTNLTSHRSDRVMIGLMVLGILFGSSRVNAEVETVSSLDNEAESDGIEEIEKIYVYAQKRLEPLKNVPISVALIPGNEVEIIGIDEVQQFSGYVANLSTASTGIRGGFSFISLRGMPNNINSIDPRTALYVDGIPYTDFTSINSTLFDVQQIEIIRGPQSTLYGLNTEAGLINILTERPSDETEVKLRAEIGNLDTFKGTARISGALIDNKLTGSIGVFSESITGAMTNVVTGTESEEQSINVRTQFVYTPVDWIEFAFTADYQEFDDILLQNSPVFRGRDELILGRPLNDFETAYDLDGSLKSEALRVGLTTTVYLNTMDFAAVTGYRDFDRDWRVDGSFDLGRTFVADLFMIPPTVPATITDDTLSKATNEEIYQEFRFQSNGSGKFDWIAGISFSDTEFTENVSLIGLGGFSPINRVQTGQNVGVFGKFTTYFIEDRLGITGGMRWAWAERGGEALSSPFGIGFETKKNDTILLPRIALDYKYSSDILLYASIARGWLPGGFNFVTDLSTAEFGPEKTWAYEVGTKATFDDGRLRINLAAFYTSIKDYQDLVQFNPFTASLSNAEEVRINGLELEVTYTPIKDLQLSISTGYADSEYESYLFDAINDVRYDGNKVPLVPEYDFAIIATYDFLENYFVRGEILGAGSFYFNAANDNGQDPRDPARSDSYQIANAQVGYQSIDGWRASL